MQHKRSTARSALPGCAFQASEGQARPGQAARPPRSSGPSPADGVQPTRTACRIHSPFHSRSHCAIGGRATSVPETLLCVNRLFSSLLFLFYSSSIPLLFLFWHHISLQSPTATAQLSSNGRAVSPLRLHRSNPLSSAAVMLSITSCSPDNANNANNADDRMTAPQCLIHQPRKSHSGLQRYCREATGKTAAQAGSGSETRKPKAVIGLRPGDLLLENSRIRAKVRKCQIAKSS
jgi:hypothetical protein